MIWCKLTHFNLVEESKGIEPYTFKRTHCFPGRPYHHQGLLTNCGENRARTCTPVSRYRFSRPGRYQLRFTLPFVLSHTLYDNGGVTYLHHSPKYFAHPQGFEPSPILLLFRNGLEPFGHANERVYVAQVLGFEPKLLVLETIVLPLTLYLCVRNQLRLR